MNKTTIDISEDLHFLVADMIGVERYKVNLNDLTVRCDSVEDIEKVTKFLNLLKKVRYISAPNRDINSVISCIVDKNEVKQC